MLSRNLRMQNDGWNAILVAKGSAKIELNHGRGQSCGFQQSEQAFRRTRGNPREISQCERRVKEGVQFGYPLGTDGCDLKMAVEEVFERVPVDLRHANCHAFKFWESAFVHTDAEQLSRARGFRLIDYGWRLEVGTRVHSDCASWEWVCFCEIGCGWPRLVFGTGQATRGGPRIRIPVEGPWLNILSLALEIGLMNNDRTKSARSAAEAHSGPPHIALVFEHSRGYGAAWATVAASPRRLDGQVHPIGFYKPIIWSFVLRLNGSAPSPEDLGRQGKMGRGIVPKAVAKGVSAT
ncbi:hypothetical protein B0H14DRAFT_3144175 [Mycena olivaceomarginata]|nr:hypothetical protein B0H14DRAFT_3144175 [Mycena olivaceomarginata]